MDDWQKTIAELEQLIRTLERQGNTTAANSWRGLLCRFKDIQAASKNCPENLKNGE